MRRNGLPTIAAGFAAIALAVVLFSYGRLIRRLEIVANSAAAGIVESESIAENGTRPSRTIPS